MFLLYIAVELAALAALVSLVGLGWTILIVLAAFVAGLILAGSQARRAVGELRRGVRPAGSAAADGAMIALGTVAIVIPGLVSSVIGLLALMPPTRALLRPALTAVAARQLGRHAVFVRTGVSGSGGSAMWTDRTDYIDGEVVGEVHHEVVDMTDTADCPTGTASRRPPHRDLPA